MELFGFYKIDDIDYHYTTEISKLHNMVSKPNRVKSFICKNQIKSENLRRNSVAYRGGGGQGGRGPVWLIKK